MAISITESLSAKEEGRWLVFQYFPVALFSLKTSRASSTAGKTLLTPTPYSVKMAFLDVALRHGLTDAPESLVKDLAKASLRVGIPRDACVTGTIHKVRQERSSTERKRNPELSRYSANIAMREFIHYAGPMSVAFDSQTCSPEFVRLLRQAAPAVNYFGKRGSFFQYSGCFLKAELDHSFTRPMAGKIGEDAQAGQVATLDDIGVDASFHNLNTFSSGDVQRGVDRIFIETVIPFKVYNAGAGFVHYRAAGDTIEEEP